MTWNLLTEPIFTVDSPDGARETLSLPAVLQRLSSGVPTDFGALQAHQIQSWESFLIQLGALATHTNRGAIPATEDAWRGAIRALTAGDDDPWSLVVEDIQKPAFMQPPIAGKDYRAPKDAYDTPDELDMLVTSKNHDVKGARASRARPEHWVFMLVSLQTCDGYPGLLNYGVARMNTGTGSRPSVGATTGLSVDARFRRDLGLWNERRAEIANDFGLGAEGAHALLWTVPWDGGSSLALSEIDPCCIEVCRQMRLGTLRERLVAWKAPSTTRRVDADARKGELGDIWIPIKRGEPRTAFTSGENGFSYKVLSELLLGEKFDRAAAMEVCREDARGVQIIARVLVRGRGKTSGLHERVLPIPERARRAVFGAKSEREPVAALAKTRVDDVAMVQNKVLHVALCALLQAAAEGQKLDVSDKRTRPFERDFDARIDALFFEALWEDLELAATDPNAAAAAWHRRALDAAREVFREAMGAVPLPSVRAYRARAIAERVFEGSAHKHFPNARKPHTAETAEEVSP